MSNPFDLNIELQQYVDSLIELEYVDETTKLPIDLTGYQALIEVRYWDGDGRVLLQIKEDTAVAQPDTLSRINLGGAAGTVNIDIRHEDLLYKPWDKAFYDLVLTTPTGRRVMLCKGFIVLTATRALGV